MEMKRLAGCARLTYSMAWTPERGVRSMGNYLNVGNAGFFSMRKDTYIDKTGMIAFMNRRLGTKYKLTCVSRPRRFGKSFAAQMLCAYYDKSCDSRELFEGLEISEDACQSGCGHLSERYENDQK